MLLQARPIKTGYFFFFLLIAFLSACDKPHSKLIAVKILQDYPSGSGLVCFNNNIYIIGDDAANILAVDTNFAAVDSIPLFQSAEKRISKDSKSDLESIAPVRLNRATSLLLPGSGSLSPQRDVCWIVDTATKEKKEYRLDTFYNRVRNEGIRDLNIEGAATLPFGIVLASRGNKSFAKNYLIVTANRFWEKQDSAFITLIKAGTNTDTSSFAGISGLDYSYLTDQLLITVSTENTRNSYEDGAIGKSYLWIINDISSKRRWNAINPDRIIDLEEIDARFKGNKVESVCIVKDHRKEKELVLVADDDKGGTVLFRMILRGTK